MAFGFFKKNVSADLVLHNGNIITLDADLPEATAVACRDNKIVAVGDYDDIKHLIDNNTETIDLEGQYLVPGFISLFEYPVMEAFDGLYADLSSCASPDDLILHLGNWIDANGDAEIIFGFGYNEGIFTKDFEEDPSKAVALLDSCCEDKPVVILSKNNITCLLNSCALDIVKAAAEEEMVEYITTPYVLNVLMPFDFDVLAQTIEKQIEDSLSHGITSVLSLDSPEHFESLYQDVLLGLYNEETLNQRFFGSYYMSRPLMEKGLSNHLMNRKNTCIELDDFVNANILYVDLNTAACPVEFTQEMLNSILESVSDKGFDIILKAADSGDLSMAYYSLEHIRQRGYKNLFAIESSDPIPAVYSNELIYADSAYVIDKSMDIFKTAEAAEIIGMTSKLGSIETGKIADMAVFPSNPFESSKLSKASITVFNGKVFHF